MKKKVLGIGEVVIDKVHKLASFPEEGGKVLAQEVEKNLGGPVPAALILLARLGVDCVLSASVGEDESGSIVKKILEKEGVHLLKQTSENTPVHTVLVNAQTGSRTIIKDRKATGSLKNISNELICSMDAILCDRHEPHAVNEAIKNKRSQTPLIMDPSVDCSSQTVQLLKTVEFPIVPVEAVQMLFPHKSLKESTKKLSLLLEKHVVVTLGKYGSAVYENTIFTVHPTPSVKVVDTLGAGDIFRGGFAFGILNGWDIHRSVQFANNVAALQCTKLGNSNAIPTKFEIISFQKSITNSSHLSFI